MRAKQYPTYFIALSTALFFVFLLNWQQVVANDKTSNSTPIKVGFIMCGPMAEMGWNTAHNNGRLYLEKAMSGKVKTIYAEKIPENAEAARVLERMITQGVKVIFLTSFGFMEPGLKVAANHPDVIFIQVGRLNKQSLPNFGMYYSYYYEPLYAAGIVAGRMTKTNNIGFVLGHPVPPLLASVNTFVLGAHSVNKKVKVHMVFTDSWDDPVMEAESARSLIDNGADIIASNMNASLPSCLAAAKLGVYSIGTHYDLNNQVPKYWLTGQCHNWGPLYVKIVQSVIDGTWKPGINCYHLQDGYSDLSSFGQAVPQSIRKEALDSIQQIKSGKLVVFKGPLKDSQGKVRIPAGKAIDDMSLGSMDWVVEGVEGSFGKK